MATKAKPKPKVKMKAKPKAKTKAKPKAKRVQKPKPAEPAEVEAPEKELEQEPVVPEEQHDDHSEAEDLVEKGLDEAVNEHEDLGVEEP